MTTPPVVSCERMHATLGVSDISAAVNYYTTKLGFKESFIWGQPPSFAGVMLGEVQLFMEPGSANTEHAVIFVIEDADALFAYQVANGVKVIEPIDDRPYGVRDYMVADADGNLLCFGHYIYNGGEPLEIERVDVPLRLEKRLAGMLEDLATFKRMSLSSLFEEILLHTSERLGNGVPSPHTSRQLDVIQELKKKHGIDYDSHASYRFVEKRAE